jgi:hypothetical protein
VSPRIICISYFYHVSNILRQASLSYPQTTGCNSVKVLFINMTEISAYLIDSQFIVILVWRSFAQQVGEMGHTRCFWSYKTSLCLGSHLLHILRDSDMLRNILAILNEGELSFETYANRCNYRLIYAASLCQPSPLLCNLIQHGKKITCYCKFVCIH